MIVKVKQAKDFITTPWTGGTTTELFIYPEESTYTLRNFDFRLSTATVETDTSTFTPLQGISRKLLLLSGEMTLHHEGETSQKLKKFDIAAFDGGWKTSSIGQCVDFNLMMRGNNRGSIVAIEIREDEQTLVEISPNANYQFIYLLNGMLNVSIDSQTHAITSGDLLCIEHPNISAVNVKALLESEAVFVSIWR